MNPLTILITTYAPPGGELRIEAVKQAVETWKEHLILERDIHVHIADDGSPPDLDYGTTFWGRLLDGWASWSYSKQSRGGLGVSINEGLVACQAISPFILYPMDDWALNCDLELEPWIQVLDMHPEIGCVRMGQPSGSVRGGRGKRYGGRVGVIFERYAFYWSLSPSLYHRRFFEAYGDLMEGASPAKTEVAFNAAICAEEGGPEVLVAMFTPWQHLWSLKLGDLEPDQKVPAERFRATVNRGGYNF